MGLVSFIQVGNKLYSDKETLVKMIEKYLEYYNNERLQRNLGVFTPMEKYDSSV